MQKATVNGTTLDYEIHGTGEPVLLIHGSHVADALAPLTAQPALAGYQLIRCRRRGFGAAEPPVHPSATSFEEQAADAVALLDHLGVTAAHVAGHSFGGSVALELASTVPERVQSLALLEPAVPAMMTDPAGAEAMLPVFERYASGDHDGAVRAFFGFIADRDWEAAIEATVPGGVAQAISDAAIFFESEVPALMAMSFDADKAAGISCPVLSVLGTHTSPANKMARDMLHDWFPQCEDADITGATHLLQMEQPDAVATAVAGFLSRNKASV